MYYTNCKLQAGLVLQAAGFLGPVREGAPDEWSIDFDKRGNVAANTVNF